MTSAVVVAHDTWLSRDEGVKMEQKPLAIRDALAGQEYRHRLQHMLAERYGHLYHIAYSDRLFTQAAAAQSQWWHFLVELKVDLPSSKTIEQHLLEFASALPVERTGNAMHKRGSSTILFAVRYDIDTPAPVASTETKAVDSNEKAHQGSFHLNEALRRRLLLAKSGRGADKSEHKKADEHASHPVHTKRSLHIMCGQPLNRLMHVSRVSKASLQRAFGVSNVAQIMKMTIVSARSGKYSLQTLFLDENAHLVGKRIHVFDVRGFACSDSSCFLTTENSDGASGKPFTVLANDYSKGLCQLDRVVESLDSSGILGKSPVIFGIVADFASVKISAYEPDAYAYESFILDSASVALSASHSSPVQCFKIAVAKWWQWTSKSAHWLPESDQLHVNPFAEMMDPFDSTEAADSDRGTRRKQIAAEDASTSSAYSVESHHSCRNIRTVPNGFRRHVVKIRADGMQMAAPSSDSTHSSATSASHDRNFSDLLLACASCPMWGEVASQMPRNVGINVHDGHVYLAHDLPIPLRCGQ